MYTLYLKIYLYNFRNNCFLAASIQLSSCLMEKMDIESKNNSYS